jgi:hypothetical protein
MCCGDVSRQWCGKAQQAVARLGKGMAGVVGLGGAVSDGVRRGRAAKVRSDAVEFRPGQIRWGEPCSARCCCVTLVALERGKPDEARSDEIMCSVVRLVRSGRAR